MINNRPILFTERFGKQTRDYLYLSENSRVWLNHGYSWCQSVDSCFGIVNFVIRAWHLPGNIPTQMSTPRSASVASGIEGRLGCAVIRTTGFRGVLQRLFAKTFGLGLFDSTPDAAAPNNTLDMFAASADKLLRETWGRPLHVPSQNLSSQTVHLQSRNGCALCRNLYHACRLPS